MAVAFVFHEQGANSKGVLVAPPLALRSWPIKSETMRIILLQNVYLSKKDGLILTRSVQLTLWFQVISLSCFSNKKTSAKQQLSSLLWDAWCNACRLLPSNSASGMSARLANRNLKYCLQEHGNVGEETLLARHELSGCCWVVKLTLSPG